MSPIYLLCLAGFLLAGLALHKFNNLKLFKSKKHLLLFYLIAYPIGIIWDTFSVSQKIWVFPGFGLLGPRIGILPIEEYLFFLIIPYFGFSLYKTIEKHI